MRMIPNLVVLDPCDAIEVVKRRSPSPITTARSICVSPAVEFLF